LVAPGGQVSCPSVPSRPISDYAPIQNEVVNSDHPVLDKFILVIRLVVNETANSRDGLHIIKMFVDLIGSATPSSEDRTFVCDVLRAAVIRVDGRTKGREAALTCILNEQLSMKRDASFVADLAFPSSSGYLLQGSATSLVVSFAAVAVALVALLF